MISVVDLPLPVYLLKWQQGTTEFALMLDTDSPLYLSQWLSSVFQRHDEFCYLAILCSSGYLQIAKNGNLLICVLAVVFLFYLTESAIGLSVSYYFLSKSNGCDWRLKRSRGNCCTLGQFKVSVISYCSAIYQQM